MWPYTAEELDYLAAFVLRPPVLRAPTMRLAAAKGVADRPVEPADSRLAGRPLTFRGGA